MDLHNASSFLVELSEDKSSLVCVGLSTVIGSCIYVARWEDICCNPMKCLHVVWHRHIISKQLNKIKEISDNNFHIIAMATGN